MLDKIKDVINIPSMVVSSAVAVFAVVAKLGIDIQGPTEKLNMHIQQEKIYHVEQTIKIDSTTLHVQHVEGLIEGILRGECIENKKENLIRQGLIEKCKELGINRE